MAVVPYVMSAPTVPRFLKHIKTSGVPDQVNGKYLKSVGFKSNNDISLIGAFKAIDFLSDSGAPTEKWRAFRDATKGPIVLAEGIRQGYADLFKTYPDAYRKDDEAVRNWIRSNTNFGGATIDRALRTFRVLCGAANFESAAVDSEGLHASSSAIPLDESRAQGRRLEKQVIQGPSGVVININVQLQLPASDDAAVYDHFFAAMKKHLLDDGTAS